LDKYPEVAASVPVNEWIYEPGVPASAPKPTSEAFARVEEQARRWLRREIHTQQLPTAQWTTQEWLHFLRFFQQASESSVADVGGNQNRITVIHPANEMEELDSAFHLTRSGNSEIVFQWLLMSIRNRYEPANARLEEFLLSIGRRKFIKPLYEELAKTPRNKERALAIYRRARPTYHPIAVASIDDVLKWPPRL
jgi:hypothetical protein